MGMDVCGNNKDHEKGSYFRNTVWWWHPLWNYCCRVAPKICSKVKHGHTNDGDGLDGDDSKSLAVALIVEIESGRTEAYQNEYRAKLDQIPDEQCSLCAGTGKRQDPPAVGAGNYPCNGCGQKGTIRPFSTNYPFDVSNVKEFVEFLEHCNGFQIC